MRVLRRHLETLSSEGSELASQCLRYVYVYTYFLICKIFVLLVYAIVILMCSIMYVFKRC
jgi:hypothetical protein